MADALGRLELELRAHRASPRWDATGRVATGICVLITPSVSRAEIETWVILRPTSLRDHGGEFCFPGGKPEAGDVNLEATAVREAAEELGIPATAFRTIGSLSPVPLATSNFVIHPIVAFVAPGHPPRPEPQEVAELIRTPLPDFLDGRVGYEAVDMGDYVSPIFRFGDGRMYGASAHVLLELLTLYARAEGLRMPDPVMVDVPPWRTTR